MSCRFERALDNAFQDQVARIHADLRKGVAEMPTDLPGDLFWGPNYNANQKDETTLDIRGQYLEFNMADSSDVAILDVAMPKINGMEAATGWMRSETKHGLVDFRLVAIRVETGNIYRFLFNFI